MRLGKQELVGLEPVELKKVMEEALNGAVEPGVGLKLPETDLPVEPHYSAVEAAGAVVRLTAEMAVMLMHILPRAEAEGLGEPQGQAPQEPRGIQLSAAPAEVVEVEMTVETSVIMEEREEIGVVVGVEAQKVLEVLRVERAELEARAVV
jgi:hypothetical protein